MTPQGTKAPATDTHTLDSMQMILQGTRDDGTKKTVTLHIADPAKCAELGAGGDGDTIEDFASFGENILDSYEDGALVQLNADNAKELLNGVDKKGKGKGKAKPDDGGQGEGEEGKAAA